MGISIRKGQFCRVQRDFCGQIWDIYELSLIGNIDFVEVGEERFRRSKDGKILDEIVIGRLGGWWKFVVKVIFELFEFIDLFGLGWKEVVSWALETFLIEILEVLFIFELGNFGPFLKDLLEHAFFLVELLIVKMRKLGDIFLCAGNHHWK